MYNKEYMHAYYLKNKERDRERRQIRAADWSKNHPESAAIRAKRRRIKARLLLDEIKSKSACIICGEKEPCCLDAHHTDPGDKDWNRMRSLAAVMYSRGQARMLRDLEKCVWLCANCHRKFHAGKVQIPTKQAPQSL